MRIILLSAMLLSIAQLAFTQQDSTSAKTTAFKFDLHYLSNNVYQGRKDSVAVPYLSAGVELVGSSGLYAAASASYLTNQSRIDVFELEGGYDFSKNNFDAGLSAYQAFYNEQSTNVKAELNASISAYAGYTFSFIRPNLSGSVSIGHNRPDYAATFGLEHSFATNDDAFSFTPAVNFNASTQNYYDSYYKTRRFARGKKKNVLVTTTAQVLNASKFKLLDYEFTATAEYKVKNFSFYFTPTYAIPENPAVVVITATGPNGGTQTRTNTENISNSFYCSIGATYNLPLK